VLDAIETVRAGGMYFVTTWRKPASAANVLDRPVIECALTLREQQVAAWWRRPGIEGNRERIDLGVRTVEKHRRSVMQKVGVQEVASLTRWCIQVGLIEP